MNSGKVVLGVLAGLATGAILGILFAPDKGSVTRKNILDKGEGYTEDLKAKFDEFVKKMSGKFDSAKKDAEDLVEKGKSKYDDTKREFKNATTEKSNSM